MSSKIISWKKGEDLKLSKNFSTAEFTCRCSHSSCITQQIDEELITKLQKLRDTLKKPITITSGFRCSSHQADIREAGTQTAKGKSSHEAGLAADIKVEGIPTADLEKKVLKLFDNVGTAKTFIHVDVRDPKPDGSKRRWTYS